MSQNTFKPTNTLKAPAAEAEPKRKPALKLAPGRKFTLVTGLICVSAGIFLVIAMVSYLFTGAIDQSVVEGGPENNLRDAGKETENWAGYIGALCSHYLIFKGLGFSMLLVPFWMLNFGYKLIFKKIIGSDSRIRLEDSFSDLVDQHIAWKFRLLKWSGRKHECISRCRWL